MTDTFEGVRDLDAEHFTAAMLGAGPVSGPPNLRPVPGPEGSLKILPALVGVMRAVSHVGKNSYNEQQRYQFRGIDGVMNAIGPAVREFGVIAAPHQIDLRYRDARTTLDKPTREVVGKIVYRFYAEDGSYISVEVPAESLDQSDKGSAKAMSVALRIAWLQLLTLPTQEPTTDHDGHYHTRGGEPRMTQFERTTGTALLAVPTDEQRAAAGSILASAALRQAIDFKACIDEHGAWLTPTNGDESPTWGDLYAARIAAEVANVDTAEEGAELWTLLRDVKLLELEHDGKQIGQLMRERSKAIKERNATALNTITEQVLHAQLDDFDGIDSPAYMSIQAALHLRRITDEQANTLLALAQERRAKLLAELNQAEQDDSEYAQGPTA